MTKTSFTPEEQKLNAEIAEIVTQIEILDRKLQQLLSMRSPEIRKLNEERDKAVTTKAVRSAAITSAAATGLSDVLGDIFGD
jgi:chorismate mutase